MTSLFSLRMQILPCNTQTTFRIAYFNLASFPNHLSTSMLRGKQDLRCLCVRVSVKITLKQLANFKVSKS